MFCRNRFSKSLAILQGTLLAMLFGLLFYRGRTVLQLQHRSVLYFAWRSSWKLHLRGQRHQIINEPHFARFLAPFFFWVEDDCIHVVPILFGLPASSNDDIANRKRFAPEDDVCVNVVSRDDIVRDWWHECKMATSIPIDRECVVIGKRTCLETHLVAPLPVQIHPLLMTLRTKCLFFCQQRRPHQDLCWSLPVFPHNGVQELLLEAARRKKLFT
mmetsp:Transcript_26749/g.41622  ORF Transcript_26749/g.41622 Transcript_26749/m.41622 type:complete len:215 (+) Transcript_26749:623-1267(+)